MRFWTKKTSLKYEDEERWAKLRVKRDEESGEDYFDILIGKVGRPWHAHLGIPLDQTLLFQEDRGLIRRIGRRIESPQEGLIEERDSMVSSDLPEKTSLILKLHVDRRGGEIAVLDFGLARTQGG